MSADAPINPAAYTPDANGILTAKWAKLGFNDPATPTEVDALFPGHQGPVAIGLLRMWIHASDTQKESAEYRETFDSVNADIFGPDTPKLFPVS